jgi:hypothetical protein
LQGAAESRYFMPKSVIFVDSRVSKYQPLVDGLTEPADVFVAEGNADGLPQMTLLNLNIRSD